MDIPWFGTTDWQTMYDWPEHRKFVAQYSLNVVWDIVDAREKIAKNNVNIDKALVDPEHALLTDVKARAYADQNLPLEDFPARLKVAKPVIDDLEEFINVPDSELPERDRKTKSLVGIVKNAIAENQILTERMSRKRKELAEKITGKAVLIGYVATGTLD